MLLDNITVVLSSGIGGHNVWIETAAVWLTLRLTSAVANEMRDVRHRELVTSTTMIDRRQQPAQLN